MKAANLIGIAILGGVGWWAYQKYSIGSKMIVAIDSIKVSGSILSPQFDVILKISNPTNYGAIITSSQGTISDNTGNIIADIFINGTYTVKPNDIILLPLSINATLSSLLKQASQIFQTKSGDFILNGSVVIDGLPIPFYQNFTF